MEDDRLAVLFAVQTVSQHQLTVTPPTIFRFLPRILRDKWHEGYLRNVILTELLKSGCLSLNQPRAGILSYSLTPRGKRAIR